MLYQARVYAILSGQLLFTAGTIHAFHLNPEIQNWMLLHPVGRKGTKAAQSIRLIPFF